MADEPDAPAPPPAAEGTPAEAPPPAPPPPRKPLIPHGISAIVLVGVGIAWLVVSASAASLLALIPGILFLGGGLLLAALQLLPGPADGDSAESP